MSTSSNPPKPSDYEGRLSRLEVWRERARGAWMVLSIVGGMLGTVALGTGAWVWAISAQVNAQDAQVQRVSERLDEHARRGGPQGHPDSIIEGIRGNTARIGTIESQMEDIRAALAAQDGKLDTLLERLPARGHR